VSPEPRSLEAVYRASRLPLTRLAYLLVGDRNEAEDVVQAVFMTAVARWDRIDEPWAYLRRAS
jgi:DNA-directed RNA polymerase specialized sigma24 family protein